MAHASSSVRQHHQYVTRSTAATSSSPQQGPRRSRKASASIEKLNKAFEAASKKPENDFAHAKRMVKEHKMIVPSRSRVSQQRTPQPQPKEIPVVVEEKPLKTKFLFPDAGDNVNEILQNTFLSAKKSIILVMYAISSRDIIKSLTSAADRGVRVVAVYDSAETSDDPHFLGKKIAGYPRGGKVPMHNKLIAVDDEEVFIGSANLSFSSLKGKEAQGCQGNLIVQLSSKEVARRIETIANTLISNTNLTEPPLRVRYQRTELTLYSNPFHGRLSYDFLLQQIRTAKKSILVAMYTFVNKKIANELIAAKNRSVTVSVILDQENMHKMNTPVFSLLTRNGVTCGYRTKKGLLHYKVVIIDGKRLITGSCNFTGAAFGPAAKVAQGSAESLLVLENLPKALQGKINDWWPTVEQESTLMSTT
jgi:phosphatidylserine/phosphatidylglycerophosphate/cardiolipin synthase-like enzyme